MRRCRWFTHDWDDGVDPGGLDGGACVTNTILYTCRKCGKQKRRYWA